MTLFRFPYLSSYHCNPSHCASLGTALICCYLLKIVILSPLIIMYKCIGTRFCTGFYIITAYNLLDALNYVFVKEEGGNEISTCFFSFYAYFVPVFNILQACMYCIPTNLFSHQVCQNWLNCDFVYQMMQFA